MNQTIRRLWAALLAASLLGSLLIPAFAEETAAMEPAETVALETTAPEPIPVETTMPETVPEETVVPPAEPAIPETVPEETAAPETVPPEAANPETVPMESTIPETLPEETAPLETLPGETVWEPAEEAARATASGDWNFCFGLLHGHAPDDLSVSECFALAAQEENLDFYAITEETAYFAYRPEAWEAGKAAAGAGEDFLALWGYEFTWPTDRKIGHITTFGLENNIPYDKKEHRKAADYYDDLPDGSLSQFNHPGNRGDFSRFAYEAQYDSLVSLIEISEGGKLALSQYVSALNKGWHLAPTAAPEDCYVDQISKTSLRTVVLAKELTEEALFDAIRSRRVYASEDADLEIYFRAGDTLMGGELSKRPWELSVNLADPSDAAGEPGSGKVEVLNDSGRVISTEYYSDPEAVLCLPLPGDDDSGYYFLKITQPDGDTAVTAPIWVREVYSDFGVSEFTAFPTEGREGEEVTLRVTLYNHERKGLDLDPLTISADGDPIFMEPMTIPAGQTKTVEIPYSCGMPGTVTFVLTARGKMEEQEVSITSENLKLSILPKEPPELVSIEAVRKEELVGQMVLVEGFVTAGTSNPYTTFPGLIYLQDDTGGIAVSGCPAEGLAAGTHLSVLGIVNLEEENYVLSWLTHSVTDTPEKKIDPKTTSNRVITDYEAHGGELMQAKGTVVSRSLTTDGEGLTRFVLRDKQGDELTVVIEDAIRSATYGTNELADEIRKGRTVRVRGLVHREQGKTVLRVRNCDEVVYIPPRQTIPDKTNPKTGDGSALWLALLLSSGTAAVGLGRKRKK